LFQCSAIATGRNARTAGIAFIKVRSYDHAEHRHIHGGMRAA